VDVDALRQCAYLLPDSGSIPVPMQADGVRRRMRLLTAEASGFRGLRRVASGVGVPGAHYESVALLLTGSRQFRHPVPQRPGARFWPSRGGGARG